MEKLEQMLALTLGERFVLNQEMTKLAFQEQLVESIYGKSAWLQIQMKIN